MIIRFIVPAIRNGSPVDTPGDDPSLVPFARRLEMKLMNKRLPRGAYLLLNEVVR